MLSKAIRTAAGAVEGSGWAILGWQPSWVSIDPWVEKHRI